MKCLLGIDPEKTQKCKPSECASCGWEAAEAARRRTLYIGVEWETPVLEQIQMKEVRR